MNFCRIILTGALFLAAPLSCAQNTVLDNTPDATAKAPERCWNLYFQATSIGDTHGTFTAPYTGPLSLRDYTERDVSLTTTLFFTLRLEQNTFLVFFDPEIAGGKGFSGVNGIAGSAQQ